MLKRSLVVAVLLWAGSAPSAMAADGISGTWSTGPGPNEQTYVFRVQDNRFIGMVCGPCDDSATVFRIDDGRVLDETRLSFAVVRAGRSRDLITATVKGTQMTLATRRDGAAAASSVVLYRVQAKRTAAAPAMAPPRASDIEGLWVAAGRVAQQNFTLKVRDNRVWGVVCGPCGDPDGVFLIEDGILDGNTISFYIHHIDTPVESVRTTGVRRNFMQGTIDGNVMRFKWVREGRENEAGGEMVLFGPLR
jgi:hypothetical protein